VRCSPVDSKTLASSGLAITFPPAGARQIDAAQQHRQLRIVKFEALIVARGTWQLKAADFQPLVPNAQAIVIPEENLDAIPAAIHKQKQMPRQRILLENLLSQAHQAIEAVSQVGGSSAEKDPDRGREAQHD